MHDPVNHPRHYTAHPSGVECIQITRHMGFNLGNALKYIWRCDLKKDAVEDLRKARWYIDEEIKLRTEPRTVRLPQSHTGTNLTNLTGNQSGAGTGFDWNTCADKECGK